MSNLSSDNPKHVLLAGLADVAKALASGNRIDLLEHLAQGEKSVDALAAKTGLTVANTSQHLQALRRVGLVVGERRGKQVVYRMSASDVLDLIAALRTVGERHTDAVKALEQMLADGLVTLLDVRPPDEFAAGHVPGALNIPLAELQARLDEVPSEAEVIAYCRGPWCVLAFEAVAFLRKQDRRARRLDVGLPEWRRAGLPVIGAAVA
jgi:rhodanese-related sulfurtransferase/predicted transcriptional regulator